MLKTDYQLDVVTAMDGVTAAILDFFQQLDEDFYPPISQRIEIRKYIAGIIEEDGALIVAMDGDRIAGLLGMTFTHPRFRHVIQYVAVHDAYRKQNIAQTLMKRSFEMFRQRGAERVTLRTWSTNEASQRLYHRSGFVLFDKVFNDRGAGVHSYYFGKSLIADYLRKKISSLGILGGMGSFATGNFIKTLTSINKNIVSDQDSLSFVLVNEASIPSRTESIRHNRVEELVEAVNKGIETIANAGVSHMVLLCVTLHPFINRLRIPKSIELINLVDLTKAMITRARGRWMLAATLSTYTMGTFADAYTVNPLPAAQLRIQEVINEIKTGMDPVYYKDELASIAKENHCNGIVLGCTDLHGMYGYDQHFDGVGILDPLVELSFLVEAKRFDA